MQAFKEVLLEQDVFINVVKNSLINGNLNNAQTESLHLLVELQLQNSPGTMKELVVQVTNGSDPLLLLSCVVTENDYQNLRAQQGLLVDFNSFPHHFTNLIKRCLEEHQKDSPKFILVLRMNSNEFPSSTEGPIGQVCLEVLELNSFKHLCHISLNLTPATLQAKLQHLASCIKTIKMKLYSESEKAKQERTHLKQELHCSQAQLSLKTKEMECMKEEMQKKLNQEIEKNVNILMQEKELNLKIKSDSDRKLSREKREMEVRFQDQITDLKSVNHSLRKTHEELSTKNTCLENSLRDSKQKIKEIDEKLKRQNRDLNGIAKERADLKRDHHFKNELVEHLKSQISQQEKEMEEMSCIVKRNTDRIEILHHENASLRENLDSSQKKLEKREDSLKKLFLDFQKSLEIIKKFRQKMKTEDAEICSLLEATQAREKALAEQDDELTRLRRDKDEFAKKLITREAELEESRDQLKEATEKVADQESLLKRNENVISWLNKQLNEMEATGALFRKAPLTEAYMNPSSLRARISASPPAVTASLTTSTPMAPHLDTPAFMNSAQSKLSAVPPPKDISNIPEESNSHSENEKENSPRGLESKYLETTRKLASLPVRGILRANAVTQQEDKSKKSTLVSNAKSQNKRATLGKASAYFKKT